MCRLFFLVLFLCFLKANTNPFNPYRYVKKIYLEYFGTNQDHNEEGVVSKDRITSLEHLSVPFPTPGMTKSELIKQFETLHNPNHPIPNHKGWDYRLVSWNVKKFSGLNGEMPLEKMMRKIKELKPDIICFQEVYQNYDFIDDQYIPQKHLWNTKFEDLGYQLHLCHPKPVDHIDFHHRQQALAVVTKMPVIDSSCHIFKDDLQELSWPSIRFSFQKLKFLGPNGTIFTLINLHLNPKDPTGLKRQDQLKDVINEIKNDRGVIILGDFNSLNFRQLQHNGHLNEILLQNQMRKLGTTFFELEELYENGFTELFDIGAGFHEIEPLDFTKFEPVPTSDRRDALM